ncbi:hypothetical protein B0J12DRAFT_393675 [Macrophomina phaseolina]|uniref:HTH psq-type domain-containing protein n=1 Tax=Macrophomina phaseolina TaxID=35725 RepID=A0ABQ8FSE5_9PEZI|nr:hypothetical protein B0J12DRAFT_393675 [Macrophomina phaseolina]
MFGSYQEVKERVQLALDEAATQLTPNISNLAIKHDVPRLRLYRRWGGYASKSSRPPTNRLLTNDQELALVLYCQTLDEIGVSCRIHMLESSAYQLLVRSCVRQQRPSRWYCYQRESKHKERRKEKEERREEITMPSLYLQRTNQASRYV